jgi:predicted Fe-Mo cluster-binding NifX family protein
MAPTASARVDGLRRIGVLAAGIPGKEMLCPFFAKCDGLLVVDLDANIRTFRANAVRTQQSTCDLILTSGVTRLICGFIAESERKKLSAAGIDVRVASCQRPVEDLVTGFDKLPRA